MDKNIVGENRVNVRSEGGIINMESQDIGTPRICQVIH